MNEASIFVSKLKQFVFDKVKLLNKGFSDEYSNSLIEAFDLSETHKQPIRSDIILNLIEGYRCDVMGLISSISFNLEIGKTEKYFLIGWVWGDDLLAIDKSNNEVVMLAYWDYDLVTFYCAANSKNFLEAFLIHGISPLDQHFEHEEQQWTYNINKANEAAKIAGGEKYIKFWMALYPTESGTSDEPNKESFLN